VPGHRDDHRREPHSAGAIEPRSAATLTWSVAKQRQRLLADEILRRGGATCAELANLVDVSYATIRRDLRELEESGIVVRVQGGAMARPLAPWQVARTG
jgi:predicted ArsR family transcriptional regulator